MITTNFNSNIDGVLQLIEVNGSTYQIGADASASVGGIAKLYTSVTNDGDTHTDGSVDQNTLHTAISGIQQSVSTLETGSVMSITKDGAAATNPTISADGHTYILKQGSTSIATFNISKDIFVREGSVVYGTYDSATDTFTAGTADGSYSNAYIKLIIDEDNDGTQVTKTIYIPAASMVKAYTANNASGAKVELNIDSSNNITAALSTAFQNEIDNKKTKQTAVTNAAGDADKTLATLSQNANGEISYTMQAIQDASSSQHGLMSAANYIKLNAIDASVTANTLSIVTQAAS